ncbi:MAG: 5'-methylthioadenosine nucleosidase [Acidimicrobiaceae bacterium]|nr:5'-methylthioadenosine nucleosidase [Acidimicrobiaceae bacterium]|tara:strand:+ start:38578 stop:39297 length:720 start_codon:yes stop_codon:yes gene_type:complete
MDKGLPLIVTAMEAEASPVREKLGLIGEGKPLGEGTTALLWSNEFVHLVTNGSDSRFGVDAIGTIPAGLATYLAIRKTSPKIIISAGTCGGFISRNGFIGEIILANRCVFHDRRIPLEGFVNYGIGDFPVANLDSIAYVLGFSLGTVSTGDSLDAQPYDLEFMNSVEAIAKDMEAGSVAWVSAMNNIPFAALKVVTDLVDGEIATEEEFDTNLKYASNRLSEGILSLIHELEDFRMEKR